MKHIFECEGSELVLRPLESSDIEALRILRNQPQNRKWFIFDGEISQEQQICWYDKYLKTPDDFMFSVCLPDEREKFLGAIAIYKHDSKTGYEIGRLLLDSAIMPRRGMGVDVVGMVCSSVKKWLGMGTNVHLYAEIFSDNQRSLHCFQENGFAVDGQREANGRTLMLLSKDIH